MKIVLVIALGCAAIVYVLSTKIGSEIITENVREVIKTETVTEDLLSKRIKEAIAANQASTTALAQQAYDKVYNKEVKRIEDEVKQEYIAEIEATISSDAPYWSEVKRIKRLIRNTFPEAPEVALAIAKCESNYNPKAYNPTNRDGSTDGGLFQINSTHDKRLRELGFDKFNPVDATKFARMLYEARGNKFTDWVCYTHGMIAMR